MYISSPLASHDVGRSKFFLKSHHERNGGTLETRLRPFSVSKLGTDSAPALDFVSPPSLWPPVRRIMGRRRGKKGASKEASYNFPDRSIYPGESTLAQYDADEPEPLASSVHSTAGTQMLASASSIQQYSTNPFF